MVELVLPRLVGTREAVGDLLNEQAVPSRLEGKDLVLLCRDLAAGSTSFADELVLQILVRRRALRLVLVAAPSSFVTRTRDAARRRGVQDQVVVDTAAHVVVG